MALPKHNPFLRACYLLILLATAAFMALIMRVDWPTTATAGEAKSNLQAPPTMAEEAPANLDSKPISNLVTRPEVRLYGLSRRIDFDGDVRAQVEALWTDLYNRNIPRHIAEIEAPHTLYMVYHDYQQATQSALVYLGYNVSEDINPREQEVVTVIPAGRYMATDSVLSAWAQPLNPSLTYTNDYEVFEVDAFFEVQSQQAFLSVR